MYTVLQPIVQPLRPQYSSNISITCTPLPGWHASIRSERRVAPRRDTQRSGERATLGHQRAAAPRRVLRLHPAREDHCKITILT